MKFVGFVKRINVKEGRGKRGPWKAYSAKIEKDDGSEYNEWVSLGFDAPPFKEGDYVQLETEENEGRQQYVKGSAKVKKNAPARASQNTSNKGSTGGTATGGAQGGTGFNEPARQASITYQSSRKDAIEIVSLLLANGALPMSEAKTKAGTAKRFDEITAAVEKFTVELYNDVTSLRVLGRVADAGVVKADASAKNDLPEDATDDDPDPDQGPEGGDESADDGWGDAE